MTFGTTIGNVASTDPTKELRQSWTTPQPLFDQLHQLFDFTIDACASDHNALLPRYWTAEDDCTKQSWKLERVWCNPPFGNIGPIMSKALEAKLAVFVLPVTALATRYFDACKPSYLCIPPNRVKFNPPEGLEVKTISPSLASIFLLFGKITKRQLIGCGSWVGTSTN